MKTAIRKYTKADAGNIKLLLEELSGNHMSSDDVSDRLNMIENSSIDSLYVCEEDKSIIGLLAFRIRENVEEANRYGEISAIVVSPRHRHKGIGALLMEYAEELAKEAGCIGTWLVSGFGREESAHEFYKSLGYKVNGYRFVKLIN